MTDSTVRKLIVTSQKDLATLGNGSILYEAFVTDEHGQVIDQPFRCFAELPIGQVAEYEVRPYDSEEYGRTFTLIPKERESRTKQLQKKVKELEGQINGIENGLDERIRKLVAEEIERNEKYGGKAPF